MFAAVERAVAELGAPDLVVANAGVGMYGPFLELAPEHLEAMIDVNLKGTLYTAAATLPHLIASGAGDFVSLASVAALRAFPGEAVYNASKFGQLGFTRALDHELREHGVRATNVCPGGIATDFAMGTGRERGLDRGHDEPEDVADTVALLRHAAAQLADADDELPADDRGLVGMSLRVGSPASASPARVFHAPLIEAVDGLELAAVMTRSPERAAQARAAIPASRVVADLDELLDGIDVLVVATPNRSHVEVALAGARARAARRRRQAARADGAREARRLLDAGGRLTVFQNRRWDGDFLTAQRLLREGALGQVIRFESRFERFRPEVDAGALARAAGRGRGRRRAARPRRPPGRPGGAAVRPAGGGLRASSHRARPGAQVDDDVFVALEHAGGVRSHLWMSASRRCTARASG